MKKFIYLTSILVCLIAYKATAQFTLSAEVRPRSEFRNGFKTLTDESKDPAFFTEQRSRLYMDYMDDKFKFKLALQDIRIWGETSQIFKEEYGKTFISEAWGQYYFTPTFSVRAGRQILSYDNQRFLGGLEWAQQGRRHDALLFQYEGIENKTKLHLGFAYNQDDDVAEPGFLQAPGADFYSVGGNYKTMQFAWFNKGFGSSSLSLLALNAGYQNAADSSVSYKQTFGAIGSTSLGAVKLAGDFYYQTGSQGGNDISALLAGVNATFKTPVTPLTLGVEYISGDDDPTDGKSNNFSPDFGTNHAHNGFMDYFFVGPANGAVGVTDLYLKTKFNFAGGALKVHAHEFLTGSTQVAGDGSELEKTMGTEIDLVYGKQLAKGVTWNIGYSHMFATDTMEALRGGDKGAIQNWAWTMLTFKPTLFTSK
ncbi:alginate export family protein [Echinicola jeungdonensis]|uniref:Alginate export family protein n=1 Tax=Echinicola jeungdonensis TaxID=709343 RepID=A0ABV5J9V1_9BACT|nr:alginate export family protein [Echinicola jeungdonensis]MDN3669138.1 alginate export family protein [Echinicola jeungdonensis]